MYVLALMMVVSTLTTSRNIDKIYAKVFSDDIALNFRISDFWLHEQQPIKVHKKNCLHFPSPKCINYHITRQCCFCHWKDINNCLPLGGLQGLF